MAEVGIEVEVFAHTDPTTRIEVLNGAIQPSFLEELKGPGGGNVTLSIYDPKVAADPTLLAYRNLLKVKVAGRVVGGMIVGKKSSTIIDSTSDQEAIQVSGEGLRNWFNDAAVYPVAGLKKTSFVDRAFNFASVEGDWYDPAQWAEPTRVVQWGNIDGSPWRYAPANWPDVPNAFWVWSQDSLPGAPLGDNFFRLKFTAAVTGTYSFFLAGDDQYSVYVDAQAVLQSDLSTSAYTDTQRVDMQLDAGDHIIGVRVTNTSGTGALLAALFYYTVPIPVTALGTVTITIANPAVITKTAHGLHDGDRVYFLTTIALPSGIDPNIQYYVVNSTTNTLQVSFTPGGTPIATTGTQSGVHTMYIPEVPSAAQLITYSGMTIASTSTLLATATAKTATDLATYTALPAGNPAGTVAQKAQAVAKAAALALYNKDLQDQARAQTEYNAALATGLDWKVAGYPSPLPGWSPGEIVLTLLSEAETRGVRFPLWLTPTFTTTHDTYGNLWDRSLDWSFGVGDSLAAVVSKLEELVCDVWINPDTLELNMAIERGVDRSIYTYDVDGITPLTVPLVFEKGKNLGSAKIDGVGEIANALLVSSADGWLGINDADTTSNTEYGRIEAKLDTGVSESISTLVADVVFAAKAIPAEGASYTVIPIPGYVPFVDFFPGDWVLAPNDIGALVKRRIMSIGVEEDEGGNPLYSIEFDTIFQDSDAKLSVWLQKLGGGSLGGQFANSGSGASSPIGVPVVVQPGVPVILIPAAPRNLTAISSGYWSPNGVDAYSEMSLSWDAVTSNTDGTATVPYLYEVWGHLTSAPDGAYERFAVTPDNHAIIRPFQPGTQWTFHVRALNSANAVGSYSDPYDHTMVAPSVALDAPDTPTLTSDKGVLIVTWSGQLAAADPPSQFRYVYAMVATSSGGTYTRMGAALLRDGRNIYISGLVPGTPYWVKLVAVDGAGLESALSSYATTTLLGIDLGSLEADVSAAIAAADAAAISAHGTSNLLFDPGFEANDPTIWSLLTADVTNVTPTPRSGLRSLSVKASTAPYTASRYGHNIPVEDGESYYISGWVRALGAGSTVENGVALSVEYGVTEATMSSSEEIALSPDGVATAYTLIAGTWNVPAGTRFVRPIITVSADTSNTNTYLFDDLTFRRQIPGSLIVDGAISAGKIAAGAVVADSIAASAIDSSKIQANTIVAGNIAAGTITTNEIAAGTITAADIAAGTIEVTNLKSTVGASLDISTNASVNILASSVTTVTSAQNSTQSTVETMATYYQFGAGGAVVASPYSPFAVHIASDRIEILQLSVPVSYWTAGQMYVRSFVGDEVSLGNHKIEKYGTETVVRAI